MVLVNNNISPLPFYATAAEQDRFKDYAFGSIYPLCCHRNYLLPFYLFVPIDYSLTSFYVRALDNTKTYTFSGPALQDMGFAEIAISETYKAIYFPAKVPLSIYAGEDLPIGQAVIVLNFTGALFTSEVLTLCDNVDNLLKLEYSNSYPLEFKHGLLDFNSGNNKLYLYLPTQLGKPEYVFEEEATERGGYTFIELQTSKKIYKCTFVAPEYLCDALRIAYLCDNKVVTSKNKAYDLIHYNMEVEWQEQGNLAEVTLELETDNVINNISGFMKEALGTDFNSDFNKDFKV